MVNKKRKKSGREKVSLPLITIKKPENFEGEIP